MSSKLKSTYAVTIDYNTVDRWLKQHRSALLAGTLERPMLEDDGKPEDYVDEIATIVKAEPLADRERVHTELRRRYRVAISHKRLRTYLEALDRSSITGGSTSMSRDSIAR